jgi:hypothetical protein
VVTASSCAATVLVDEVPDHEIADIAGGIEDPQRAADELVAMANRHGGRDNVTVVVVDVLDGVDPGVDPGADEPRDAPLLADDDRARERTATLPARDGRRRERVLPAGAGDAPAADGTAGDAVRRDDDDTAEMDASLVEGCRGSAGPRRRRSHAG